MPIVNLTISIDLGVSDIGAFRQSAYNRAIQDGLSHAEASDFLLVDEEAEGYKSLGECAVMVIDPGESPDGCEIYGSGCN